MLKSIKTTTQIILQYLLGKLLRNLDDGLEGSGKRLEDGLETAENFEEGIAVFFAARIFSLWRRLRELLSAENQV